MKCERVGGKILDSLYLNDLKLIHIPLLIAARVYMLQCSVSIVMKELSFNLKLPNGQAET